MAGLENGWHEGYAQLKGARLHYVEAGQGPLVVLLHGFPEAWFSYRHQLSALARAGFRAVAPDMRGYNLSSKPRGLRRYRLDLLARDVAELVRACGAGRAVVVGHDWGALVAWHFAMRHPEMVDRLVILNVPHPARALDGLRSLRQLRRSWYIFFFQLPWLPEALIRAGNYAYLRRTLRRDPCGTGAFSEADIEDYVQAIGRPGALTAGLNYYRALLWGGTWGLRRAFRRIDAPVLVIWGEHDPYLGIELAAPDLTWVPHARVEYLPDAGHWVQNDRPELVNALLLDFLNPPLPRISS
jgi:epoxide hydrolase 4